MTTVASAWRPFDAADAAWSGRDFVRAFVDLDLPPWEDLRRAVLTLSAEPAVARWFRVERGVWRAVAAAERAQWSAEVLLSDTEPAIDHDRALQAQDAPLGDVPFRIIVGQGWLSLRMNHGLGDGWTAMALLGLLLRRATGEVTSPPWRQVPQRHRDANTAVFLVRHGRSVASAMRHRQSLRGGDYEPATLNAARIRHTTASRVSPEGFTDAVRADRDQRFPGASVAAMTLVGLRSSLALTLPQLRPGFECVYNTRDVDGRTARAFGNWSVGVYLHPADDASPVAVTAAIARARAAQLPGIASASMRVRSLRRSAARPAVVVAPKGAPRISLSYTNRHSLTAPMGVDLLHPTRCTIAHASVPNGVETISISAFELGSRLHLNLSYYPQVWATSAIEAALDAFLGDPAAVLETRTDGRVISS